MRTKRWRDLSESASFCLVQAIVHDLRGDAPSPLPGVTFGPNVSLSWEAQLNVSGVAHYLELMREEEASPLLSFDDPGA